MILQLTQEQALAVYKSHEWLDWTNEQIVKMQLYQDRLCVPFGVFHASLEAVLGRPVYTHEFATDRLRQEYEGVAPRPTLEEIIALLPQAIILIEA